MKSSQGTVLKAKNISKVYNRRQANIQALSSVNISVQAGEFVCIIGPNGCGKSTLLKIIAGILSPSSGSLKPAETAYLPQQTSLLPWRTLLENLLLPADIQRKPLAKIKTRAMSLLKEFKLAEFAAFYPDTLSGGMQQKAVLLRTVLEGPKLMLLDEPFSALDAITRSKMQDWLLELWGRTRPAVICVTHDVREALFLADTIYVLSSRPGTVAKKITVDLPRPRRPEQLHTKTARSLETQLNNLLRVKS